MRRFYPIVTGKPKFYYKKFSIIYIQPAVVIFYTWPTENKAQKHTSLCFFFSDI